jgi:transcriptional regulator with XRE-family HTH domain
MDQIRDLGYWRQQGARLRRLRERQHLSLRDCARVTGISAEALLNIEVGNIYAFIHGGKIDSGVLLAYEQFLQNTLISVSGKTSLTHNRSDLRLDPSLNMSPPRFLTTD